MQNSLQPSQLDNQQVELNSLSNSEIKTLVSETSSVLKAIIISFLVFLLSIIMLNATAQTVVTFNTAGTTSWVCPPLVTSIKVEAWGAGGAHRCCRVRQELPDRRFGRGTRRGGVDRPSGHQGVAAQ